MIRKAKIKDIKEIQKIEKEYYEGFSCDESTLKSWIENGNFYIYEDKNKMSESEEIHNVNF